MAEKVYLIDGSAYIYRAYHAIAPLSNKKGQATNAIYGFVNILKRIIKEKKPSHLAIAFDARGPVFRHDIYSAYKANRPPMPEDLASQIPYIKSITKAFNLCVWETKGVEADDSIATAAKGLASQGYDVVIISGDKDLLQLVDERITMWEPMNNKSYGVEQVIDKYNVSPALLLDCFALMGDSADNIPGVPGVGPKTAEKLINQYGSLDSIYEHIDGMKKSKTKERLIENKEAAYLSKSLIDLKYDVELSVEIDDYLVKDPNEQKLQALYEELEFTRLLKDKKVYADIPKKQFHLANTPQELQNLDLALKKADILAIDTETDSVDARNAKLVGISLAVDLSSFWYIPIGHLDLEGGDNSLVEGQISLETAKKLLLPYLSDKTLPKLGHNLKYDYTVLAGNFNIDISGSLLDTMIASYLLAPSKRSYKLDVLCDELGYKLTAFEDVVDNIKVPGCFQYVTLSKACEYSCEDVFGVLKLWEFLKPQLKEEKLFSLFCDVEMPLVPILANMERDGIRVDCEALELLSDEFEEKLERYEKDIYLIAGEKFNIKSPKQLATILFEKLKLPHGRKTKTGYSTDAKTMEKLSVRHELPGAILKYRNLAKLQSTYIVSLMELIDSKTSRVHSSFNQTVTATGRLSSSKPNLQNIPIRTIDGNKIRKTFVPEEGKIFLSMDYSQIDLRVLAHYSQDEALLKAFNTGDDIHTQTAAEIFSVSPLFVSPDMRRAAKSVNFGIVYGMTSFGLASQLDISRKEAQSFIDRYLKHYAGVKRYMEEVVEQARKNQFVTTLLGRRRQVADINAQNKTRREFAERTAINTPIQGTAADIIKLAMIKVDSEIKEKSLPVKMLLQIHDELVFELYEQDLEYIQKIICPIMENAMLLDVPLVVNCENGYNLAKS